MKLLTGLLLAIILCTTPCRAAALLPPESIPVEAPTACLLEVSTGQVIYEKDAHSRRPIASVTKVMTLLLILEAIDDGTLTWDTPVTASANAASMGGSQIWLEEGETMTVAEMVKCITVVSANDCSVAMAEHLRGSEAAFVAAMNDRAAALGLDNTHFANCTGLFDHPDHYSTAHDVAVMARALIAHEDIKRYTTIWTDTARDGAFGLSNTNKLIRFYDGATGLKTGFTDGAKYCLAATAERDGVEYAAAVLGCDTSDIRFESAKTLLSHAFAHYTTADLHTVTALPPIPVALGSADFVQPRYPDDCTVLLEQTALSSLEWELELAPALTAPVAPGAPVGVLRIRTAEGPLAELPLTASDGVSRLSAAQIFGILCRMTFCPK